MPSLLDLLADAGAPIGVLGPALAALSVTSWRAACNPPAMVCPIVALGIPPLSRITFWLRLESREGEALPSPLSTSMVPSDLRSMASETFSLGKRATPALRTEDEDTLVSSSSSSQSA